MRFTDEWLANYHARQKAAYARGNQLTEVKTPSGDVVHLEVPQPVPEQAPRRRSNNHEEQKQMALLEWAELVTVGPWTLADLLVHVPNGGKRSPAEAGRFRAMGVKRGYPDLLLDVPAGPWHGGRWELKHGDNDLTESQATWHRVLQSHGFYVRTFWEWEDAARDILAYLSESNYTITERAKL